MHSPKTIAKLHETLDRNRAEQEAQRAPKSVFGPSGRPPQAVAVTK